MANIEPEKEKLQLIEVIDTKDKGGILGGILNFPRTISVADGFSIEVFRREKNGERHIGSILSKSALVSSEIQNSYESIGVGKDDLLLRVNLGGKLITMTGTFTTNDPDPHQPGYRIVFELAVVNPKQFAIRHRGQDDPIGIALAALEGEFRTYASLRSYDRLKPDELRYRAAHTLNVGPNKDIGLDVVRVHDVTILMDPYKQKEFEVRRNASVKKVEIEEEQNIESIKAQFTRDQAAINKQFERDQYAIDQAAKRTQDDLDAMAQILKDVRRGQLRDKLESGWTLEEIYSEHPNLLGIYAELPPMTRNGYIATSSRPELSRGMRQNNTVDGLAEVDAASPRGTSRQKMNALSVHDLGFTLLPAMLTEAQQSITERSESEAFVVCVVNPGEAAALAGMLIGDIVVKVNEEVVSNTETLPDALRLRNQDQQISMHVLRGKQVVKLYINSIA